ncbi:hypothetical protein MmTuc01_2395 [Methanosarcina mazei Tuc01]|uniref:Uncharacterized protein n=1 Tax=Methanosarcina mazei Tuc01 TaxID=1236903 RepID=M1Q5S2_METMZ|nr:hypothetical protein MmTuc01_2395 [Methanosarcina mazei Tuc01]
MRDENIKKMRLLLSDAEEVMSSFLKALWQYGFFIFEKIPISVFNRNSF